MEKWDGLCSLWNLWFITIRIRKMRALHWEIQAGSEEYLQSIWWWGKCNDNITVRSRTKKQIVKGWNLQNQRWLTQDDKNQPKIVAGEKGRSKEGHRGTQTSIPDKQVGKHWGWWIDDDKLMLTENSRRMNSKERMMTTNLSKNCNEQTVKNRLQESNDEERPATNRNKNEHVGQQLATIKQRQIDHNAGTKTNRQPHRIAVSKRRTIERTYN